MLVQPKQAVVFLFLKVHGSEKEFQIIGTGMNELLNYSKVLKYWDT